ncbi:MAG: thioredoxin domain-containing protein, partial [Chloroflexota bacterium]|nr:thioredoxin domain-containing protein [Chloroflexota bacterium]
HLGGGFARYAVDAIWLVPHFEKMLYDNAQLMSIYLDAWRITGIQRYRDVVEEIATWLLREMRSPDGGFYSALDADSEGVEGKFYVWSASEIDALLEPEAADLIRLHYGVTESGNFEGHTILFENRTLEEIADATDRPLAEIRATIGAAKRTLLDARSQRIRPGTDDKVVVSWNGMMIAALADAGLVLDRPDLIDAARTAATLIVESGKDGEGHLCRTLKAGQARGTGVLEDYAALAGGLVSLYRATAEGRWLDEANALVGIVQSAFPHESGIGFYDTSDFHEDLVVRPRDLQDGAIACGNSLAAGILLTIGAYRGETGIEDDVRRMLASLAKPMAEHPTAFGRWLSGLERLLEGTRELVLAGPANEERAALRTIFARRYEPFAVLGYATEPPAFPMLANRPLPDGAGAAAYLCQNFTCLAPVTTPDDLTRLLDQHNAFSDESA